MLNGKFISLGNNALVLLSLHALHAMNDSRAQIASGRKSRARLQLCALCVIMCAGVVTSLVKREIKFIRINKAKPSFAYAKFFSLSLSVDALLRGLERNCIISKLFSLHLDLILSNEAQPGSL